MESGDVHYEQQIAHRCHSLKQHGTKLEEDMGLCSIKSIFLEEMGEIYQVCVCCLSTVENTDWLGNLDEGDSDVEELEEEDGDDILEVHKAFVMIHRKMVVLKNYISLNFAGLDKILKKYDKRTGGELNPPFTQRALHRCFFATEPLTRLVHECEANLKLLFPLVAEFIESLPLEKTAWCSDRRNLEASSVQRGYI